MALPRFLSRAHEVRPAGDAPQLALMGVPEPGHPYWNEATLAGVQARYPGLDMGPWRDACALTRRMRTSELTTPALLVDAGRLEDNLRTMAEALPGDRLRPHVKAHKCTGLATRQAAAGHTAFTCATVREMEGMARAGLGDDLLLANEVVDAHASGRCSPGPALASPSPSTPTPPSTRRRGPAFPRC